MLLCLLREVVLPERRLYRYLSTVRQSAFRGSAPRECLASASRTPWEVPCASQHEAYFLHHRSANLINWKRYPYCSVRGLPIDGRYPFGKSENRLEYPAPCGQHIPSLLPAFWLTLNATQLHFLEKEALKSSATLCLVEKWFCVMSLRLTFAVFKRRDALGDYSVEHQISVILFYFSSSDFPGQKCRKNAIDGNR